VAAKLTDPSLKAKITHEKFTNDDFSKLKNSAKNCNESGDSEKKAYDEVLSSSDLEPAKKMIKLGTP